MDSDSEDAFPPTDPVITHVSSHESLSTAIVGAMTDALDRDPDSLPPVSDSIDLGALGRLYRNSENLAGVDLHITFTVADCEVLLYGDGRIAVFPVRDRRTQDDDEENRGSDSRSL